jgi:hypothetical protein
VTPAEEIDSSTLKAILANPAAPKVVDPSSCPGCGNRYLFDLLERNRERIYAK